MDFESILRTIQPFLVLFIALFAAFLTATWVSAVIWTFRDIRSRTRDIFAQILATLMVLIFFPLFPIPGLVLYLLLRPRETLAEIYERTLEEEALLQGIEERLACPGCNRSIEEDFIVCPTCHTRLKKPCVACGRRLHLRWSICPFCGSSQSQTVPPPPEAVILPKETAAGAPRLREPATRALAQPEAVAEVDSTAADGFDGDSVDDAAFGAWPYSEGGADDEDWDTWSDSELGPEPGLEEEQDEEPEDVLPEGEENGLELESPPGVESATQVTAQSQSDLGPETVPDAELRAEADAQPVEDFEPDEIPEDGAPEADEHEGSV